MRVRDLSLAAAGLALALPLGCGPSDPGQAPPAPEVAEDAAPAREPAPSPPSEPSPGAAGDVARGEATYATYCASCHGPGGDGDGPLAANLDPKPASHSDAAYMSGLSDEHLFRVVKEGGPAVGKSPLMAAWGGTLSDQDVHDLVSYMRSLSR